MFGALIAVLIGAVILATFVLSRELRARRREATVSAILSIFAPWIAKASDDPRALVACSPVAQVARRLFPDTFRELDAAAGATFPFSRSQAADAHARWTAEWLEWERAHDAEYKLKAAAVEAEIDRLADGDTTLEKARLAAIEREKLDRYQQRYVEYVRIGKALASLDKQE